MLSVNEARELILARFQPVETVDVSLQEAAGRILASPVVANIDLPSFDNSSVDGFAIRTSDFAAASPDKSITLQVIGDIPAGAPAITPLHDGECMRIMTGASIPPSADAVVMVEDTDFNYRDPGKPAPGIVTINKQVLPGENIRWQGADVHAGQEILSGPHRLRAQDIGLLAMLGISRVEVFRKPRIAVLSTGDELISVDESLAPGKVRDANSLALSTLAVNAGAEVMYLGIAKDDPLSIKNLLDKAVDDRMDAIISSAGVSVGAYDYVKNVVETQGSLDFWKVNMRPGKPLAFGQYRGIPFFGLPGNPVSAFIGYLVFIAPVIEKLSGLEINRRPVNRVRLAEGIESDGRESYLRAVVNLENGQLAARLTGHQLSSNLLSMVQANALLIIPSGVKSVPPGDEVDAWML